jgi:hypothetical protein
MKLFELTESSKFKVIKDGRITIGDKTFTQHPVDRRSGYKLVLIDAKLLEKLWGRSGEGWVIGPGPEYKNQIKNRIENFKKYYDENNEIRVGDVHVRENGVAGFGDGRHRTRVLIEKGMKMIPISMTDESIQNLMANEGKGGSTTAKMIAATKKGKAKKMNPKANKTNQIISTGSRPNDHEAGMGDTTNGSRYQASTSSINDT